MLEIKAQDELSVTRPSVSLRDFSPFVCGFACSIPYKHSKQDKLIHIGTNSYMGSRSNFLLFNLG